MKEEQVDLLLMSESWERENLRLDEIIKLDDHSIISNVGQRSGVGGRPAIFANNKKYEVQNITNTLVQIPWGVEAVWCILTPKNVTNDSQIQKIACCAIYSKPASKKKSLLLDHLSDSYNLLSKKYGRGLHFVIAGDTNDLKLDSILSLDSRLVQIVQEWTRLNPPAILDPIIMTLSSYYQEPKCLEPLDCDPEKNGKKSDHRIVLCRPINTINNKSARQIRKVKVRPFPQSGMDQLTEWFIDQTWDQVYSEQSAHKKAEIFQHLLTQKLDEIFPVKTRRISSDDQPWITHKLKQMDRQKKRIYKKERKSVKWRKMDKIFRKEVKLAKSAFYAKKVADLKLKKPSQWYACLKQITSQDQHKTEQPIVDEIRHLSDQDQAEQIANQFAKIQNEYAALKDDDVQIPVFHERDIPTFSPAKVWFALTKLNANKATVTGDFPAKLCKHFAAYLAEPLSDILNTAVRRGEYPEIYKFEVSTPVPKIYPTQKVSQPRNLSGLFNFNKIIEKLLAELIISDMEANLDPSQFGNQKGISVEHYLIKMLHRILSVLDSNSKKETVAVIVNLIDWENAFPRQCPKLGVQSFIENGVRPALIPILINYFQDRKMSVKWHGQRSSVRKIKGGGPQGATLGILEYLSQSNKCANFVSEQDKFRFVDDLSVLEIVNLLTVGLTCYNLKQHVPSDLPSHNQFIPAENLQSQYWLNEINEWTENQKMKINETKTKSMIFNFTNNFQFTTRLTLKNQKIEVLKSTKLLGTIISDDLKWDLNTRNLVKKANARMELLRRVSSFNPPLEDLKIVYFLFVRSILEQSATVWHSSLTKENSDDIERIQKSAVKIMLGDKYCGYKKSLEKLDIDTLKDRREQLCLKFALKASKNLKTKHMFPENEKLHAMQMRKPERFKVDHAKTERLKNSSIIFMQHLLNKYEK